MIAIPNGLTAMWQPLADVATPDWSACHPVTSPQWHATILGWDIWPNHTMPCVSLEPLTRIQLDDLTRGPELTRQHSRQPNHMAWPNWATRHHETRLGQLSRPICLAHVFHMPNTVSDPSNCCVTHGNADISTLNVSRVNFRSAFGFLVNACYVPSDLSRWSHNPMVEIMPHQQISNSA